MNREEIAALQDKAQRALTAAEQHIANGDYDFAVSKFYYVLFYEVEALLLTKGISFSKHAATISAFYEHFIKPGLLPKAMHQFLTKAFDERMSADYEALTKFTLEEAQSMLTEARTFLEAAESLLESLP